jgi:hypothetical protein
VVSSERACWSNAGMVKQCREGIAGSGNSGLGFVWLKDARDAGANGHQEGIVVSNKGVAVKRAGSGDEEGVHGQTTAHWGGCS